MPDDEELAKLGIGLSSKEVVARARGKKESDGPSAEENEDKNKNKKNKHLWRKYMKIITMVRMRRFVNYTLGLIIRC